MPALDDIEAVARAAVYSGGAVLRDRYQAGGTEATYGEYDAKATADETAEEVILPVIRGAFPEHSLFAEEAGAAIREDGFLSVAACDEERLHILWETVTDACQ